MSELKAYNTKYEQVLDEVYLKSEADKVIALLTDKANYNEYAYKLKSEELADTCRFYEDEIRRQKYKRCLAMAKWCERKRFDAANYRIPRETWEFYDKWHRRWFKIAEQFKEAK